MKRFKKGGNTSKTGAVISVLFILLSVSVGAYAHHVLGRPAYSLNEDSNTPPSMQVETQIGEYFLTYMVFPAFPKPGENGRINVYASRIDNGDTFQGEMSFSVRNDNWFGDKNEESIGTQNVDDGVYRQGFLFKEKGNYIITAKFTSGGEPYIIDFPLQIGESSSMLPVGIALGSIVFVLITVNIIQRKRLMREKIRAARNEPE
ncbi:MAG TPA: hypothetical protein ENJ08_01060 [Gammaproteobacteria bacterium]|nr:hypothetical protein [Gammaproteobacteria bacterium]